VKRVTLLAVGFVVALLPLSLLAGDSYRVTVTLYPGDDAAAVAKRLAATYRGEIERPVEAAGDTFTMAIVLDTREAALLARDPHVEAVVQTSTAALPSAPLHPVQGHSATDWTLGNYAYDGSGNIRKIGSDLFVYDGKNRVVRADAGAGFQQEYGYDGFGNLHTVLTDVPATLVRTTASLSPYRTRIAVNPATNRAEYPGTETNQPDTVDPLTQQSYSMAAVYDSRGNATALQINKADTFEYDVLDMARKASIAGAWRLYIYSASDERIGTIDLSGQNGAEVTSDWTFRDMGGQVLRRMSRSPSGAWTWKEDYIYRDGQLLAAQVPDAVKVKHFHLDHLGTPRLITGNGGIELSRHTYYAFGGETGASTAGEKQFTGHERDSATLDYMHARYYYPQMGRFLSADPLASSARLEIPQSWNRYTYAWNNPVLLQDPTGMDVFLDGGTAEERQRELDALKHTLHDPMMATRVVAVKMSDGRFKVRILGDADEFSMSGAPASILAAAVGVNATITFGFGQGSEITKAFGARTDQVGNTRNSNVRVDDEMFPSVLPKAYGNVWLTLDVAILHELGHALGLAWNDQSKIGQGWEDGGTNRDALAVENRIRAWYMMKAHEKVGSDSRLGRLAEKWFAPRPCHNPCF
jgi:RHS repeat-associated protein